MKTAAKVSLNIAAAVAAILVFLAMNPAAPGSAQDDVQKRTLQVGPGKEFARIEDAYEAAKPNDTIEVYPLPNNEPYRQVALLVRKPGLDFLGMGTEGAKVCIDGGGFDYSGDGQVPRAIFQFDPEGGAASLKNLKLINAHNSSHNGAGIRINAASGINVEHCEISGCDMGIMSNGMKGEALNQDIFFSSIHDNGSLAEQGYGHNLYLGGESVHIIGCEIYRSTSGHNLKSRARHTMIESSYIHDSANRELDIVDDGELTSEPGANAVVIGCIIVKAMDCPGNYGVIHFGQDIGGSRNGTLYVINCNIATPFFTPVVTLNSPGANVVFGNCIFYNFGSEEKTALAAWDFGGELKTRIDSCVASPGFLIPPDMKATGNGLKPFPPEAVKDLPADWLYRPVPGAPLAGYGVPFSDLGLPYFEGKKDLFYVLHEYLHPASSKMRSDYPKTAIGAFEEEGET